MRGWQSIKERRGRARPDKPQQGQASRDTPVEVRSLAMTAPSPTRFLQFCLRVLALATLALVPSAATAQSDASTPVQATLASLLAEGEHPYLPALDLKRYWLQLETVYATSKHTLLWVQNGTATPQALEMLGALRSAENLGLRSADYEANRLAYLLVDHLTTPDITAEAWALFDVGLTAATIAYVHDLHFGRIDPRDAGLALTIEHARLDLAAVTVNLSRLNDPSGLLRGLEPPFLHYELLKKALQRYRELSFEPELTALAAFDARSIKPGDPYAGAPQLRRLLTALGDLPAATSEPSSTAAEIFDADLSAALARFQKRNGLDVDGALGQSTYRALTVPLSSRARQIELTLERWRWLPPKLETPPIIVNIPQFRLFGFRTVEDREADMLTMDVIVGKAFRANQTPVFTEDMKYIVLRPYWEVPYSITTREFLPSIRSNPSYLKHHRLEIVGAAGVPLPATRENIERLATGGLRLRQQPGPQNSLGLAKFMMPNPYNVYLHGTPSQGLFARASRAFSHGCVRVADPVALAEFVLRDDATWTREKIEGAMNGTSPTQVNLKQPIRVFIVYGTAVATEAGQLQFFEDIYGHDARLDALLAASAAR